MGGHLVRRLGRGLMVLVMECRLVGHLSSLEEDAGQEEDRLDLDCHPNILEVVALLEVPVLEDLDLEVLALEVPVLEALVLEVLIRVFLRPWSFSSIMPPT